MPSTCPPCAVDFAVAEAVEEVVVDPLTTTLEEADAADASNLFCNFIFPFNRSVEAGFTCFEFVFAVAVDIVPGQSTFQTNVSDFPTQRRAGRGRE